MQQTAVFHVQGPPELPHQEAQVVAQTLQHLAESVLAEQIKITEKKSLYCY